jgi:hypothetical protein
MTDEDITELDRELIHNMMKYEMRVRPLRVAKERPFIYTIVVICPFCHTRTRQGGVRVLQLRRLSTVLSCRNCGKRFKVASLISITKDKLAEIALGSRAVFRAVLRFQGYG